MDELVRVVVKVLIREVSHDSTQVLVSYKATIDGKPVPTDMKPEWVTVGHEAKIGVGFPRFGREG